MTSELEELRQWKAEHSHWGINPDVHASLQTALAAATELTRDVGQQLLDCNTELAAATARAAKAEEHWREFSAEVAGWEMQCEGLTEELQQATARAEAAEAATKIQHDYAEVVRAQCITQRERAEAAERERDEYVERLERALRREERKDVYREQAEADRDEAVGLLRRLEWVTSSEAIAELPHCPLCQSWKDDGHDDDCALARLPGATEGS